MKKGMKRTFTLGTAFVAALNLSSCGKLYGPPPDGDRFDFTPTVTSEQKATIAFAGQIPEFSLKQWMEPADFTGNDEIPGWFGAKEYLDSRYHAVKDEDGNLTRPDVYVSYILTAYPDYSDEKSAITCIIIKDPHVLVFGLNTESSITEFDDELIRNGFTVEQSEGLQHTARLDDVTITYGNGEIRIEADVTNKEGIVF